MNKILSIIKQFAHKTIEEISDILNSMFGFKFDIFHRCKHFWTNAISRLRNTQSLQIIASKQDLAKKHDLESPRINVDKLNFVVKQDVVVTQTSRDKASLERGVKTYKSKSGQGKRRVVSKNK